MSERGVNVRMGEWAVLSGEGTLFTLLGSCIGLVLHDPRATIGGLAHIVLPDSRGACDTPGKFADTAIVHLVDELEDRGADRGRLAAVVTGGANMFASESMTIGTENARAVERMLARFRIPVRARDCGGEHGRRLTFDVGTGEAFVEQVGTRDRTKL